MTCGIGCWEHEAGVRERRNSGREGRVGEKGEQRENFLLDWLCLWLAPRRSPYAQSAPGRGTRMRLWRRYGSRSPKPAARLRLYHAVSAGGTDMLRVRKLPGSGNPFSCRRRCVCLAPRGAYAPRVPVRRTYRYACGTPDGVSVSAKRRLR
jgi:hypothetical protein